MEGRGTHRETIRTLQRRLDAHATEKRRDWWTRYLKGDAVFRGVAMGDIRAEVRTLPPDRDLAIGLLHERHSEDKLAGVLLLAEHLLGDLGPDDLPLLARPLDDGAVADWNVCDWYAVKVLAPLCRRDGEQFARPLATWSRDGATLWTRRAPAAAFATLAPKPEPFAGFTELCVDVCEALAPDGERFAQTAIGWLLRELSKQRPDVVLAFVADHDLSTEARRMATAKIEGRGRR